MDIKAQEAWAAPAFVRISGGAVGYSRAETRFRKPFRGAERQRADDLADIIRENGVAVEYTVI